MRNSIVKFLAVIGASLWISPAMSGEQFVDKNGVANFGYDVVAYHSTFAATLGSSDFQSTYNEAVFYFASEENRVLFEEQPETFVPAYDGHCAFALTQHKKLTIDPEAFSIINPSTNEIHSQSTYSLETPGVLYLNYSPGVNEDFNEDIADNIVKANVAWENCLELKPAARPKKSFRDLFGGKRPKSCPPVEK